MALQQYLRPELVFVCEDMASRDALFEQISKAAGAAEPDLDGAALLRHLLAREKQSPTSTPEGVAFPHALAPDIDRTLVAAARVKSGVDFGVPSHPPADLILCMFGNSDEPWEHVRILARLARLVHTDEARDRLRTADDPDRLYALLLDEDRSHE